MTEDCETQLLIDSVRQKVEELLSSDAYSEEAKLSLIRELMAILASDGAPKGNEVLS